MLLRDAVSMHFANMDPGSAPHSEACSWQTGRKRTWSPILAVVLIGCVTLEDSAFWCFCFSSVKQCEFRRSVCVSVPSHASPPKGARSFAHSDSAALKHSFYLPCVLSPGSTISVREQLMDLSAPVNIELSKDAAAHAAIMASV